MLSPAKIETLKAELVSETRGWANGATNLDASTEIRHHLLLANHARYVEGLGV